MTTEQTEMERWRELHPAEIPQAMTAVAVHSLLVPSVTVDAYRDQTLTEARERVENRRMAITRAEQAVVEAEHGLQLAQDSNVWFQQNLWQGRLQGARSRVTKHKHSLVRAEDFLALVEEGYLPIPRLPSVEVHRLADPLPPDALQVLVHEQGRGIFTEFAVIGGRDRFARSRATGRDPILVGVCDGELFPLAWWR